MNKALSLLALLLVLASCLSPHTWYLKKLGESPCPDCECNDPWAIPEVSE